MDRNDKSTHCAFATGANSLVYVGVAARALDFTDFLRNGSQSRMFMPARSTQTELSLIPIYLFGTTRNATVSTHLR